MKKYSTNLSESQWKTRLDILEDKRKRKHCLREFFIAIFYLVRKVVNEGCFQKIFQNGS